MPKYTKGMIEMLHMARGKLGMLPSKFTALKIHLLEN